MLIRVTEYPDDNDPSVGDLEFKTVPRIGDKIIYGAHGPDDIYVVNVVEHHISDDSSEALILVRVTKQQ